MSTNPIRIVFCGTPDFAVPSLQALIDHDAYQVDLVITQPDKPVGRKQVHTAPPIKHCAEKYGIAVWQPENLSKEMGDCPIQEPPDFLVVVAYGQILKQHVLDWPKIAPVNVHASLLPHWRGAAPMQHAILAADAQTGVSIQRMVAKLDRGPIIAQESIQLSDSIIIEELHDQLADMSKCLLCETLQKPLKEEGQDHDSATYCKKLSRENGKVNTEAMTAQEIHRHVRALVPWPGVTVTIDNEEVKLLGTSLVEEPDSMPLSCKQDTTLYIQQLQSAGRKPLSAIEWLHGRSISS